MDEKRKFVQTKNGRGKETQIIMIRSFFKKNVIFIILIGLSVCTYLHAQPQILPHDTSVERWEILELTFQDTEHYQNPFWDVKITAHFTGPNGEKLNMKGFYYDSTFWKVRFSPTVEGKWTYNVVYTRPSGYNTFQGSFVCKSASVTNHGFITVNAMNPHSFIFNDGSVFIPIGINGHTPAVCAAFLGIPPDSDQVLKMWDTLASQSVNAFRLMMFHQDPFQDYFEWNMEEGHANLLFKTTALDQYNTRVGKLVDKWFEQTKTHNISIYLCLFTIFDIAEYPFSSSPWSITQGGLFDTLDEMYQVTTGERFELEKKYVTYVVSRWGAYRNLILWEYNNEYGAICNMEWLAVMNNLILENDPYGRARTVSFWDSRWSKDSLVNSHGGVTATDDHFYTETLEFTEFDGDKTANEQAQYRFEKYPKPVLFGEFGSGSEMYSQSDYTFQRVAYWGALLGGGYPIFWFAGENNPIGWEYNLSIIRFLHAVNLVVSRIQDYAVMKPANETVTTSSTNTVRTFSFSNQAEYLTYLHNFSNHNSPSSGISLEYKFPYTSYIYKAEWIDASNGGSLGVESGQSSTRNLTLNVPSFNIDILLFLKLVNLGNSPYILLSTQVLNFGAINNSWATANLNTKTGHKTSYQQFRITNIGIGTLDWSISGDSDWLSYTPDSGTGNAVINVSVNPIGLSPGTYHANINVSSTNASNSPQTISVILNVYNSNQTSLPFGVFSTPADGSTVRSSIAVTGWALDDIGVEIVKIYHEEVGNLLYIGDTVFVEGARPDVEQAYPEYPMNYKAGWGYMILTNFLPNEGDGTFKIHAIATDSEGHQVTLGTKTIICDNSNAVKPFGAIDTPPQGGTASESYFINWGWVLTPQPNSIPTDGSTINVYVDGVNLGHPTYNIYRADIATLFPGYANSDGAIGRFYLDTTVYENGVHTIQWTAKDSGGNSDGIGSRYFTIQNTGNSQSKAQTTSTREVVTDQKSYHLSQIVDIPFNDSEFIRIKRGLKDDIEPELVSVDESGFFMIKAEELERLVIEFSGRSVLIEGYSIVGNQLRSLPIGSNIDTHKGKFHWQLGPGFVGYYRFVFIERSEDNQVKKINIIVSIEPKFAR